MIAVQARGERLQCSPHGELAVGGFGGEPSARWADGLLVERGSCAPSASARGRAGHGLRGARGGPRSRGEHGAGDQAADAARCGEASGVRGQEGGARAGAAAEARREEKARREVEKRRTALEAVAAEAGAAEGGGGACAASVAEGGTPSVAVGFSRRCSSRRRSM